MRRLYVLLGAIAGLAVLAGCGSSSGEGPTITVGAAHTYQVSDFTPSGPIVPGKPTRLSFTIQQPDGSPLVRYRTGAGPHTGVHLIAVPDDLSTIIHHHPKIGADGKVTDSFTFPSPGKWRLVIDAYTNALPPRTNFQLFQPLTVSGPVKKATLPPFQSSQTIDGYHFTLHGPKSLHAIQAAFLTLDVTSPDGKPVSFTPWFGALAHAIFFRSGSLDYFHTHVCAPGALACSSSVGGSRIVGQSTRPGKLSVGVLLPVSGTWRLFLQLRPNGHLVTVPFTLKVNE